MENSATEVVFPVRQKSSEEVPASEVRRTLTAILESTPFRTSKQAKELLQYVVDETLAGHPESLKERIIEYAFSRDALITTRMLILLFACELLKSESDLRFTIKQQAKNPS